MLCCGAWWWCMVDAGCWRDFDCLLFCCPAAAPQTLTHPLPPAVPAPPCLPLVPVPLQGVNYCIQNGAHLSRARVLYFKHNDPADLERLLKQQADLDRKQRWALG